MAPRFHRLAVGCAFAIAATASSVVAHEIHDLEESEASVGPGHAGRPTTEQRRTHAAPQGFETHDSRWTDLKPAHRSAAMRRSRIRLFQVVSTQFMTPRTEHVAVLDDAEYFLPEALNHLVVDSRIAANGEAYEDIARISIEAMSPTEGLTLRSVKRIRERGADGYIYGLRVRAVTRRGIELEYEFCYGEGTYRGQVRFIREYEYRDGARLELRAASPMLVEPQTSHRLTGGGDLVFGPEVYLLINYNGAATGNTARLFLSNFLDAGGNPEANVYIRVQSILAAYGPTFLTPTAVAIDAVGNGTLNWTPAGNALTGICTIQIGNANPANPAGTFAPRGDWPSANITVEKARAAKYPGATGDSVRVYYCEQFFQNHPQGTAHTETFIGYVLAGASESWQNQVIDWSLAQGHTNNEPLDSDNLHEFYVNDHLNNYRGNVTGGNGSKASISTTRREVWIRNDGYYRDVGRNLYPAPLYTNESLRTRIAVAHEFYHGVQTGWINNHVDVDAFWIIEGQARALPTVQYDPEEFVENTQHLYPLDANDFLRNHLNSSLAAQRYSGCLYWRFLYDRNRAGGTTAQRMSIFRDAVAQLPGRPLVGGSYEPPTVNATSAALAANGGLFGNWIASRDSFAHTLVRHDYPHATPTSVVWPAITGAGGGRVSGTWSGPPLTFDDAIAAHYGIDIWNFRLDPAANLRRLSLCFDGDPERNGNHSQFHLTVMLHKLGTNSARVHVLPRALASWDSTFEVKDVDSVTVVVSRVDSLANENTYRLHLARPLVVDARHWDHIQDVLDGMGPRYRYAQIDEGDLRNADFPWCRYDVIFLNCSPFATAVAPVAADSLRAFVARGGYLYVSDYDFEYIAAAWPAAINFGEKIGNEQTITAEIVDPGLSAVLGSPTAQVTYDLGAWVTVVSPGPGTTVHMRGTYEVSEGGALAALEQVHRHAPPVLKANATEPRRHGEQAVPLAGSDSRMEHPTRLLSALVHAVPAAAATANPRTMHPASAGTPAPARPEGFAFRTQTGPLLLSFPHGRGRVIYTTFHNAAQTTEAQQALLKYMIYRQVAGDVLADALALLTGGYHVYQKLVDALSPGGSRSFPFRNPFVGPIEVILNWGGSNLRLTAKRPDGTVFGSVEGPDHPIRLVIPSADEGDWTFDVVGLDVPDPNYPFALVVGGPTQIPGVPAVDPIGEGRACAEEIAVVAIPVRNESFFPDDFDAHLSSDLGWTIEPTDTTLYAWEGMVDSIYVRVTLPVGTPIGTVDSLRLTLTSQLEPANSASGVRAVRVSGAIPEVTDDGGPMVGCPGDVLVGYAQLIVTHGCPSTIVIELTGSLPWPLTPASQTVDVVPPEFVYVDYSVEIPSGTSHGETNVISILAYDEADPSARDSIQVTVSAQFAPPTIADLPSPTALRTQEVALPFQIRNNTGCFELYDVQATDSLGWSITPGPSSYYLAPGDNALYVQATVPAEAPVGASNPITLTAMRTAGGLPAGSGRARVFVQVPGEVLLLDPSGGFYVDYIRTALDSLGRTHTDWTSFTPPGLGVLEQFQRTMVVGGYLSGMSPDDTASFGAYLRGGGRLLISAQDLLRDPFYAAPFVAEYMGATQAGEGTGTFAVEGRAGTFLWSFPPTAIQGPGGAWNQYSPDELNVAQGGFAVMDYVPGASFAAPTTAPMHRIGPSAEDGGRDPARHAALATRQAGTVRGDRSRAGELEGAGARGAAQPAASLGTGIAAVARDAGGWRAVYAGFGLEALDSEAARATALDAILDFLDHGTPVNVGSQVPTSLTLAITPNPARGVLRLVVTLPEASQSRLALYDVQGREVTVLADGELAAGVHAWSWDGRLPITGAWAGGLYFARLESGGRTLVRKLALLSR